VPHARSTSHLLLVTGAAFALAGCGGDDTSEPAPTAGEAPADPDDGRPGSGRDDGTDADDEEPTADPEADGTDADDADDADGTEADDGSATGPEGTEPLRTEATTEDQEAPESSGARLTLTDVRVGAHDGFDRVTLELSGEGAVGWFTQLDTEARNHGRGDLVELDGEHALTVALRGMELPPERDDDLAAFADDTDRVEAPGETVVLTEVAIGGVFEGQKQVFLGLTEEVPVRVARFEGPERVVIDLVHP
jgi:hypothetical protein